MRWRPLQSPRPFFAHFCRTVFRGTTVGAMWRSDSLWLSFPGLDRGKTTRAPVTALGLGQRTPPGGSWIFYHDGKPAHHRGRHLGILHPAHRAFCPAQFELKVQFWRKEKARPVGTAPQRSVALRLCRFALRPRIANHFDALVFLVAEDLVHLRDLVDGDAVGDDLAGVDFAVLNSPQ